MPKFNVRVYAVVRVKYTGIDAIDAKDAITQALRKEDLDERLSNRYSADGDQEYAEEITDYLVDHMSDDGIDIMQESRFWDATHMEVMQGAMTKNDPCYEFPEDSAGSEATLGGSAMTGRE